MIKTIRNWAIGLLVFGMCIVGLAAPLLWPALYEPMIIQTPIYGIPLVQNNVEICELSLYLKDFESCNINLLIV